MVKKVDACKVNEKIFNDDDSLNNDLGLVVDNTELVNHVKNVCSKTKDEKCKKCPFREYINMIKTVWGIK